MLARMPRRRVAQHHVIRISGSQIFFRFSVPIILLTYCGQ